MAFRDDAEHLRESLNQKEREIASLNELLLKERNKPSEPLPLPRKEVDVTALHMRWSRNSRIRARLYEAAVFAVVCSVVAAILFGFVVLCGAIADGCSNPLHNGFIESRVHHEDYYTHGEICTGTGSSRQCTPTTTHHPERWTVRVAHDGRDIEVDLNYDEWQRTTVGEWYCLTAPCEPAPSPQSYEELDR